MREVEPLSIVSLVLVVTGFLFPGFIGTLLLLVGAGCLAVSYRRFKKNPSYEAKWVLYVAAAVLAAAILWRIFLLIILGIILAFIW